MDKLFFEEHYELSELARKYADDFPAYCGFLLDVYFAMKPFIREGNPDYLGLDTYELRCNRTPETERLERLRHPRRGGYSFDLRDEYDLRDNALPVIEAVEVVRPFLFKSERLSAILDLIPKLEWAHKNSAVDLFKAWQLEFAILVDRFYFTLESFRVKHLLVHGDDGTSEKPNVHIGSLPVDDRSAAGTRLEISRPKAERDAKLLAWADQGMTPAKIRDQWNLENPHDLISLENASSGRETVKKAIERERLRKTRGTR